MKKQEISPLFADKLHMMQKNEILQEDYLTDEQN